MVAEIGEVVEMAGLVHERKVWEWQLWKFDDRRIADINMRCGARDGGVVADEALIEHDTADARAFADDRIAHDGILHRRAMTDRCERTDHRVFNVRTVTDKDRFDDRA